MNRGKIIIIVAPSGTGKSTLIQRLKKDIPKLKWSVSCTTRPKREGETEGEDYFFFDQQKFENLIEKDDFIEWAKVHSHYYGTRKSFVNQGLDQGDVLLFDLDVQGCDAFRKVYGSEAKIIFIEPPSLEVLENRLLARDTDSLAVIQERLSNAKKELTRKNDFDYNIINDDIETAYKNLYQLVLKVIEGS